VAAKRADKNAPLPSREQIAAYINEHPGRVSRRDIARAFHIKADDRAWLRGQLKSLAEDGLIEKSHKRKVSAPGRLPPVAVVEVFDVDVDGEPVARPVSWQSESRPPRILVAPPKAGQTPPGIGDRVLARLERGDDGVYVAKTIRNIQAAPDQVLGVYTAVGRDGRVQPTNRRLKYEIAVAADDAKGARSGDVVLVAVLPGRSLGLRRGRVVEKLGGMGDPRALSLIAIHSHGIPTQFSREAEDEAEKAKPVRLGNRTDLREVPLITIDPADARDFDDAVWAAPDDDPDNPGGWQVLVAIADVSHYVRPDSALDKDARVRGNSVYFPDRVVPMLPEALSATLCSLQPKVQRPCMAVAMWFDADGNKLSHQFMRGLMKSAARLTYQQAQAGIDGTPDDDTAPLVEPLLKPLYGAYHALAKARAARQPLELDLPERQVEIGADGYIAAVHPRERLDAHKLIEEFMIAANVCAAETLEELRRPCMYRVHEEPALEKVQSLREFLASLDIPLAKGQVMRPALFNTVLARVAGTPDEHMVNVVVLRSQSQAYYAPYNMGHFGLALRRYAHFTSPIRRYADLLVHRALIAGLKLGAGALPPDAEEAFPELGEQISNTERRAMAAERDAMDRFTSAYMADRVGATFKGRISGVTRFGLFVELDQTGADGIIPIGTLGADFFDHDEHRHCLVGRRSGKVFRLGDRVEVRLEEADPVTGGIRFQLLSDSGRTRTAPRGRRPTRPAGTKAKKTGGKRNSSKGEKPKGQKRRKR
jgi:ribonuclease R